jgi:polyhydroxyalkanoate synthesis regulator phasin
MKITRIEEQRRIDDLYASGKITQEEWSKMFDELSSSRWTAEGKVGEEKK